MPYTCAAFVIAAISMIGIPPSVGFVSKLYIILASVEAKRFFFVGVVLVSSLLNLVYFWRVIEIMYMRRAEGDEPAHSHGTHGLKEEAPLGMLVPVLLLASLCVIMGVVWLARIPMPIMNQVNGMVGLVKMP
jgi:multicomponent Na+:H+ antiporter subunit D